MTNEELVMRIQDGEKDLFAELWGQVERLVVHIAARRLPPNGANNRIELGDLTQAGYLAMVNAVKDFDRESGTKFTTYLNLHLKNAFAGELGSKTTRRDALLQAISLNHRLGDGEGDDGAEMGDFLPDPDAENEFYVLDDRLTVQQDYEAVMKEVNKLDEKQRGDHPEAFQGQPDTGGDRRRSRRLDRAGQAIRAGRPPQTPPPSRSPGTGRELRQQSDKRLPRKGVDCV